MSELQLYLSQRLSALIMAPLVIGHIGVMIWAIRGGLGAQDLLDRVQGSAFWTCYYALFVAAVGVHGAIGLRAVASEWLGLRGRGADTLALAFLIAALVLGGNAVIALAWAR